MASTAQVGRGVGSVLGLAFGLREGGRRRKKAKADLDEKQLQAARDKQLAADRLKIFLEGDLPQEQREEFLSTRGFEPTTEQNLFRDINREGFAQGSDEEKIFREEMARREKLKQLERFGITKDVARKGAATGGLEAGTIPGLGRTPGDIADVGLTKAQTKTQESIQDFNEARVKAVNALRDKRKLVNTAKNKSDRRLKLKDLESSILKEIKIIDQATKNDISEILGIDNPEIESMKLRRADLIKEVIEVRKEQRSLAGVKEVKTPKRVTQSDITKMSVDELFEVLTKK